MMRKFAASGLTLIETMVVIAVLGILLALAAPSFRDFIAMQQLKGAANEMMSDIAYARSEALARQDNEEIRIKWSASGYSISRLRESVGPEAILKQVDLDSRITLTWPDSPDSVTFDALRGMVVGGGGVVLSHAWLDNTEIKVGIEITGMSSMSVSTSKE